MKRMTTSNVQPEATGELCLPKDSDAQAIRVYPFLTRRTLSLVSRLVKGTLQIRMPDDARLRVDGKEPGPSADIHVRNFAFARKLASNGEIGFAEAYLDGDWETSDLTAFIELFCLNRRALDSAIRGPLASRLAEMARHFMRRNTRSGARRNIHAHYDLGNEFYSLWLDPTMTYSSALFADDDDDLERAQIRKYRALADKLAIEPGMKLLEIGCGWGGFAMFAATAYGAQVRALTISKEQFEFARRRVFEAGLADRVDVVMRDYRDERDSFDRIASIEMFEAVGESYWPVWFDTLRERLTVGGRAAMQAITIDDAEFPAYRRNVDFIRRYIFPGGMLPSAKALRSLADRTGLSLQAEINFGKDYGRTLALWRERFLTSWPRLRELGFDDRFKRLWEYYLAYCEAGFRAGLIDVRQLTFVRN